MKLPFNIPTLTNDQKWGILISIIVPYFINQCHTNGKIEDAQVQAKTAVELSQLQAQQLDHVKEQNRDILSLVRDMAEKRQFDKEQINKIDEFHIIQADSLNNSIKRQRRTIDEIFRETFNKARK